MDFFGSEPAYTIILGDPSSDDPVYDALDADDTPDVAVLAQGQKVYQ